MSTDGNPYQSPDLPSLSQTPGAKQSPGLGSLAQSARTKQLKSARNIFLFIGVLTIGVNAFLWTRLRDDIRKELTADIANERRTAAAQGLELDEAEVARYMQEAETEAMKIGNLVTIGTIALGVVFVAFGIFVTAAPVPITIAGLALYVVANLGFAVFDPTSLLQGLIVKVVIIFGMVKAIKSALAYEREKRIAERQQFSM